MHSSKQGPQRALAPVNPEAGLPPDILKFATSLRSLSNYEVWKRVRSSILAHPSPDKAEIDSLRFRLLLDELQWRYSGIEGVGSVPDLDKSIAEAHRTH